MTIKMFNVWCLAVLVMTAGAAWAEEPSAAIAVKDTLYVQIQRHPELSASAQVDDSGHADLTYVGRVSVVGLNEISAAERIADAYRSILKNPKVTVSRRPMAAAVPMTTAQPRTEQMDTKIVPLNNSSAESLNDALSGMSTSGGSVSYDKNTNCLILTDTPNTLQKMMTVVQELDQMKSQLMQVHIESKVAEVESTAAKEVGIRWFAQGDHLGTGYSPSQRQDTRLNAIRGNTDANSNEQVQSGGRFGTSRDYIKNGNWDRRLQVPLVVPGAGQYFLGYMGKGIDLGTLLDALVSDNKAEMLAKPYIRTVNHQKAEIEMTEEFPFTEIGAQGFTSVSSTRFLKIGIILEVTPHVRKLEDGQTYVQLELQPEVSTATGTSNGVPVRSVRKVKGTADVMDGQTLVIGGIVNNDSRDVIQKVPGLGDVPLLGGLFRHKERSKQGRELMIFVTPHVFDTPADVTSPAPISLSETAAGTDLSQSTSASIEKRKE